MASYCPPRPVHRSPTIQDIQQARAGPCDCAGATLTITGYTLSLERCSCLVEYHPQGDNGVGIIDLYWLAKLEKVYLLPCHTTLSVSHCPRLQSVILAPGHPGVKLCMLTIGVLQIVNGFSPPPTDADAHDTTVR